MTPNRRATDNGSKITVQKLYDELIPMIKDIATTAADLLTIKEQLSNVVHIIDLSDIKSDIKDIKDDMKHKISSRAFAVWLGSLSLIIGIIITIISLIFLRG